MQVWPIDLCPPLVGVCVSSLAQKDIESIQRCAAHCEQDGGWTNQFLDQLGRPSLKL